MRSTTGEHFIPLDHVRALAAFMVFAWHFMHSTNGYPVPFEGAPLIFPLAVFDEGHTGVALFMTLSGYLFAALLHGKRMHYRQFLLNRALRLLPLLCLVVLVVGLQNVLAGGSAWTYFKNVVPGVLLPVLPNGGWSITVEFHFYIILPLLLHLLSHSWQRLAMIVVCALLLRWGLYVRLGEVHTLAYATLVGRIDQFVLGMIFFHLGAYCTGRHGWAIVLTFIFCAGYWIFDFFGGFFLQPSYPSPRALWIFWPTFEGLIYAFLIAWYDRSFAGMKGPLARAFGKVGELSYSVYLLHFFWVFHAAAWIDGRVMRIDNFYLALLWSLVLFVITLLPAWLSYRFVEMPFLKLRKKYTFPGV